jgi:glucosamine-6-phosphate deaminase
MKTFKKDKLDVNIYDSRAEMGAAAARDVSAKIKELLKSKSELNIIFAAAPSQNEVLASLAADKTIPWEKINAFHMDEYVGLCAEAPQGFGNFLSERLFSLVPLKSVSYIDVSANDPDAEAERYGRIIDAHPTDIVVMGIGENGHIAFNDPPSQISTTRKRRSPLSSTRSAVSSKSTTDALKSSSDVPTHAITLTMPTLARAPWLFCIVPRRRKPSPSKIRSAATSASIAPRRSSAHTAARRSTSIPTARR